MKKWIVLFSFPLLFSCKDEPVKPTYIQVPSAEETAEMNKGWIKEEQELINQYVERKQWKMNTTESGLRYLVYKQGTGEKAEPGMRAMIQYSITLLDGSEVYSTEESGPQPFRIEHDNVETGLHEGITYLKVGDRAKLIIPPYLAHGLMGDTYKIPPMATLIFDVRLLGVSK
ncbi:MAG: FKBP-type peptidyl-prolyl cis-trans isomerase [Flavobacteriales bacterium]